MVIFFIGVFFGLLVTHTAFSVIMTEVVAKNAIVLIDFYVQLRAQGLPVREALATWAGCASGRSCSPR